MAATEMQTARLEAAGLRLAADIGGRPGDPPVIMTHGGGQTRAAWGKAARALAAHGYYVISLDLRGHGESDWATDGDYSLEALAADVRAVGARLGQPPSLVGASLGGLSSLLAIVQGMPAKALVLVDIVPKFNREGAAKIGAFMAANPGGFASLDEAADAVSAFMPHRPRPSDVSGLRRNLREEGGRLYWHWDPAFMDGERGARSHLIAERLEEAATTVTTPTLLVRGMSSEVVDDAGVQHLRELIPHAEFIDVESAGHMVAGDKNDVFNQAIVEFLSRFSR
jgi:pimeloyl-ACP methyl ester carboxylesterase